MPTPNRYFDDIPLHLKQQFSRVHRTSGLTSDAYGDSTFTEVTSTGYRGFFQSGGTPGETIILAGKEIVYDAVVYCSATTVVSESDRILFGSSTSTSISTRYVVHGISDVYDGLRMDHKALYVRQEVI